ncbi:hypothetical protein [Flavobacterium sp. GNP001]
MIDGLIPNYQLSEISKNSIIFNLNQNDTVYFRKGTWKYEEIEEMSNSIKTIEI